VTRIRSHLPTPPKRLLAGRANARQSSTTHFDIYVDEWFERSVSDQVDFLNKTLASNRIQ